MCVFVNILLYTWHYIIAKGGLARMPKPTTQIQTIRVSDILYSRKVWRGIKFGGLVVCL